jgi:drug/metabolite transporter (DMT)-like permease
MNMTLKNRAIFALCIAALSFVILNTVSRMMNEGVGPLTQVYLRIGCAFFVSLIIFYKKINFKKLQKLPRKDWILLGIMGSVGYGIAVIFVTLSALHTSLLSVSVITSTVPFFAMLYLFVITRKPIKPVLLVFLLLSFVGVYLKATKSFSLGIHNFGIGELYALLFAAGTGAFIVSRKFVTKALSNIEITILMMGIAFLSSLFWAIVIGEGLSVNGLFHQSVLLGLAIGTVLNISTTLLQNFGFQQLNPVTGAQILLVQNIFAPIIGFLLYHETLLPIELLGALFILVGVWGYYKNVAE